MRILPRRPGRQGRAGERVHAGLERRAAEHVEVDDAGEIADVFAKDWVAIGRASALKSPGDYIAYELAGQPIFVIRDGEGKLRALSNVCRHRMSTLLEGTGNRKAITCPYHGWTYNLDGSLRGAPAMSWR